jgi:hypothetical protein
LAALIYSCSKVNECEIIELQTYVQGKKVLVNISSRSAEDLNQYNWHFSDGFSKATTTSNVEHVFTQNGEYIVEVEAEGLNGEYCYSRGVFLIEDSTFTRDTCDIDISNIKINEGLVTAEVKLEGSYDSAVFVWKTGYADYDTVYTPNFETEYTKQGNYKLKVIYTQGACKDSAVKYVNIDKVKPRCALGEITIPQIQGRYVVFPAFQNKLPGNPIYSYDFGDNSGIKKTALGFIEHRYSNFGNYRIKVNLEFENGTCYKEKIFFVRIKNPNYTGDINDSSAVTEDQYEGVSQEDEYPFDSSFDEFDDTLNQDIIYINY